MTRSQSSLFDRHFPIDHHDFQESVDRNVLRPAKGGMARELHPIVKIALVSACLVGINCRFDGSRQLRKRILELLKGSVIIPVCPEQLGGLPTPRRPAEILGGSGVEVLQGQAKVLDSSGCDITRKFLKGAERTLKIARLNRAQRAYLKEKSPSCGKVSIVKRGKVRPGPGVTAALLIQEGIEVIGVD